MHALHFPEHFPPKDRWGKFFIGVRWLGPDLSFFKELKQVQVQVQVQVQAQRALQEMEQWGGGLRQRLAQRVSSVLAMQLGWRSQVFLPDDSAAVVFHGPSFDFNDPESALAAVLEMLEQDFRLSVPPAFWAQHAESTFGEVVDGLLASGAA